MVNTLVKILYGLPASGKTTWATTNVGYVIDCDNIRGGCTPKKVAGAVRRVPRDGNPIIVDGLFTTFKQLKAVVEAINEKNTVEYELHFWKKDVDACIANDMKRPASRQAHATIKRLAKTYKKPSKRQLESIGISEVTIHKVERASYLSWWDQYNLRNPYEYDEEKRYLYSESWVIGGKNRNYHGDEWAVEVEPQPLDFVEFDQLLEKLAPSCSFMQYKRLHRETVSVQRSYSRGYYHSHDIMYYRCDLERLHELLLEMELLHE